MNGSLYNNLTVFTHCSLSLTDTHQRDYISLVARLCRSDSATTAFSPLYHSVCSKHAFKTFFSQLVCAGITGEFELQRHDSWHALYSFSQK
jgi:hypothetical protein